MSLISKAEKSFSPVLSIVVYKSDEEIYMEMHRIDKTGNLMEGAPLSKECISDLVKGFSEEQGRRPNGRIPANMLWCDTRVGHERYVWYNPPMQRMMYFVKSLGIESGLYHVPGIIYEAFGTERLNVYAYKGPKPTVKTKLYKAPFFNVTDGSVCLGNAKIDFPESPTFHSFVGYWERRFWLTEFSHLGGSQNPTKDNLVIVTKASAERFGYSQLLPMRIALNHLLK